MGRSRAARATPAALSSPPLWRGASVAFGTISMRRSPSMWRGGPWARGSSEHRSPVCNRRRRRFDRIELCSGGGRACGAGRRAFGSTAPGTGRGGSASANFADHRAVHEEAAGGEGTAAEARDQSFVGQELDGFEVTLASVLTGINNGVGPGGEVDVPQGAVLRTPGGLGDLLENVQRRQAVEKGGAESLALRVVHTELAVGEGDQPLAGSVVLVDNVSLPGGGGKRRGVGHVLQGGGDGVGRLG